MNGRGSGNDNNIYNTSRNGRRDPRRVPNGRGVPVGGGQRMEPGQPRNNDGQPPQGYSANYGIPAGQRMEPGQPRNNDGQPPQGYSANYGIPAGQRMEPGQPRNNGRQPPQGHSADYGRLVGYGQPPGPGRPVNQGQRPASGYSANYGRPAGYGQRQYGAFDVEAERRRLEYERRRAAEERRRAEYARRRAEMEMEMRRLERRLKEERRVRRKKALKLFYGRAAVCLCVFAVLCALTAGAFAFHFYRSPDDLSGGKITYQYGGNTVRECSASDAVRGGETYLCFGEMADYLNMAVTGDSQGMKFILMGDGSDASEETLEFTVGSRTAYVCGKQVTMSGECFLLGESLWIPVSFAEEFIRGVDVTADGRVVSVARLRDEERSTEKDTVYREVSLLLGDDSPLPTLSGGHSEKIDFVSDLSEYERFMAPEDPSEYLLLVNASSPLDEGYAPEDLTGVVNTRQDERETQQLRLYAAKALEALFIEMEAAGIDDMSVTSGYRSYYSQQSLFESYAAEEFAADPSISWEEAERRASVYSSRPGESEHQSGLCVDMHDLAYADEAFANTDAYKWLRENAWKFGFVLRYPEGKTGVTGITFEPWHWRYVGRADALEIYNSGLCLEEYLASR